MRSMCSTRKYGWIEGVVLRRKVMVVRRAPSLVAKTCRTLGPAVPVTCSISSCLPFCNVPIGLRQERRARTNAFAEYSSQRRQYESLSKAHESHERLRLLGGL